MKAFVNKDLAYAMTPLKFVSWPVGTWPLQEYNVAAALRSIVTVLIMLLTIIILNIEIYLDPTDPEKFLDVLLLGVCSILAIVKIMTYRIYSTDLIYNFISAVNDYEDMRDTEKRTIMRKHAYMSRMAFLAVICFSYCGSMIITVSKLLLDKEQITGNASVNEAPTYPMPSGYTLEMLNVPGNLYPIIFVTEYFIMIVISTGNLGSDALFFGVIFHLCGQAEVLKYEFVKSVNDKENTAERFDALTRRHCHLLDLSEKLNNMISSILVAQLFTSCILICTTGFQCLLSIADRNAVMIIKTLLVVVTLLIQLFAYSYIGDYLTNQMEGIGYSAYCCSWYNLPRFLARNIVFIIMRAQSQVQLKAGKFFLVNMETYMSIVKTSLSYLSVLRLMIKENTKHYCLHDTHNLAQCMDTRRILQSSIIQNSSSCHSRTPSIIKKTSALSSQSILALTKYIHCYPFTMKLYVGWTQHLVPHLTFQVQSHRKITIEPVADRLTAGESASVNRVEHLTKMKTLKNKDFVYAMSLLRLLSWPVGTWPLQEYNVASALRSIFALSVLMLMLILVSAEVYMDYTNAEKNLDALIIVPCGILAVTKVAAFRIHYADLVTNFVSAVKDYNETDDEKRVIMRRHAYMGRVASFSVIFFSYSAATLFSTVSMLATEEVQNINASIKETIYYPVPSEQILGMLNMPKNLYPVIFLTEYFMLLVTSTGNLGSDSLFFGIIFHLCGQVEVLKQEFIKFVNKGNTTKHFIVLVKRHCYLISLFEKLNDIISFVLVVQLFTSCVLICTSGFQFILSLSANNFVIVIKTLIVMNTLLVQLFAYSYIGDYFKSQIEGIGYSAYSCSWYTLPRHSARDIILVLVKSQKPIYLKAGKFFIINMETYMNILKTSMSYLSVLRVMVNN
ncbi:uncharacterized protein LOC143179598 [Calliopsis andreniformis]|uniref:uncharacterized protein LOC143179598 n=1 Tax=Calliopsis andreniformis TaxID=337506 RepID=UPI003FCEDDE4